MQLFNFQMAFFVDPTDLVDLLDLRSELSLKQIQFSKILVSMWIERYGGSVNIRLVKSLKFILRSRHSLIDICH